MRSTFLAKFDVVAGDPAVSGAVAVVLVVDDDARNRTLIRGFLESKYKVLEAPDAMRGLEVLATSEVDLVILDVMMPGMSGFDACKEIKRRHADEVLPVLMLTALSEPEERYRGLESGADDFLTKPFDRRELMLRVGTFTRIRLQERRLRQQEATIRSQLEALRALDALKDDLVSLLVHDLRNPLTGVLGYLGVMDREVLDPETREDLSAAIAAAKKLQEFIEDMLQVRTLEEGQVPVTAQRQAIGKIVRDAFSTVEGSARTQRITLACDGDLDATLACDRKLLRRALENLLVNAVKYSPEQGVVEVSVKAGGGELRLEVRDRGPGVPDSFKATMFDKFARLGSREESARAGFGLGLYLVRLVALAHGGTVEACDRDGGGTIFRLALPDR